MVAGRATLTLRGLELPRPLPWVPNGGARLHPIQFGVDTIYGHRFCGESGYHPNLGYVAETTRIASSRLSSQSVNWSTRYA